MGNHLRAPGYVACQCELSRSLPTILTEYCLVMRSIRFTRANIDSVPSLANFVSGCATETTCMDYLLARITFAGTPAIIFSLLSYSLGPLAKNTRVVPYVPRQEYAKSIQLRSP